MVELLRSYCNLSVETSRVQDLLQLLEKSRRSTVTRSIPVKGAIGLSPDQQQTLVYLYESGASTYELAARFSIRRDQVTTYLKRAGVTLRLGPQVALDEAAERRAATLYRDGLSMRAVARQMGVSDNTVLKALRAQGVPSRPQTGGAQKRSPGS